MMKKTTLAAALAVLAAGPALAQTSCDQDAARDRWLQAEASDLIAGTSMLNGAPTIHIDLDLWAVMDLNTRLGMVATLECIIAGPGNILRKVQFADPGGAVLAEFDGLSRDFRVLR